jgi:hypothetical protein
LVSCGLVVAVLAHVKWPNQIDALSIGVLILAVLIWIAPPIESLTFPGGWKVTFQKVQALGKRILESERPEKSTALPPSEAFAARTTAADGPESPSYLELSTSDPNILLVGLAIEVEKRLKKLAEKHDISVTHPPTMIARELGKRGIGKGVLSDATVSALIELLTFGKDAAHGARVEPRVAEWARDIGPDILAILDGKLRSPRM